MNLVLVVILTLHPVLEQDAPLRVAAADVDGTVAWSLDGETVAVTRDREAATFAAAAGEHVLVAQADDPDWTAMARIDASGAGARFVPAWTASARTETADGMRPGLHDADEPAAPAPPADDEGVRAPPGLDVEGTWARVLPVAAAGALALVILARHPKQT